MEPKLPESQASVLPLSVGVDGGIRTDSRVRGGGFKSHLHPSLPKWFWSSCLSFLSSTFLICTMGILIDPCRITHVKCRLYPGTLHSPQASCFALHTPPRLLSGWFWRQSINRGRHHSICSICIIMRKPLLRPCFKMSVMLLLQENH